VTRARAGDRTLRVLLVDDSSASRQQCARILRDAPGFTVAGQAGDGEEALREVSRLRPDVIVLDLHMPRMDGFTFLRMLMARQPTPVVVVSSQGRRTDVFKALELGALDFVVKPAGGSLELVRDQLLQKCATVRALRIENLGLPPRRVAEPASIMMRSRVAVIGASTGGPQAIQHLLASLPGDLPLAVLVAQHMPERFTATFAERLGRTTRLSAQEARDGDRVVAGRALVAPGGRHLELVRGEDGALRAAIRIPWPGEGPSYVPSVDRLFASAAAVLGPAVCGVVLTGMGQDGAAGVRAIKRAGGATIAESERTAVVYGMPGSAVATGAVDEVLDLAALAPRLIRFARGT
jgi:two-component system chemotaxis response regulator CheB